MSRNFTAFHLKEQAARKKPMRLVILNNIQILYFMTKIIQIIFML
jgi:hypothetical protein